MWDQLASKLKKELFSRLKKARVEIEALRDFETQGPKGAPPTEKQEAPLQSPIPAAFAAKDPVFGGASQMQQFQAMTMSGMPAPFASGTPVPEELGSEDLEKEAEEYLQKKINAILKKHFN